MLKGTCMFSALSGLYQPQLPDLFNSQPSQPSQPQEQQILQRQKLINSMAPKGDLIAFFERTGGDFRGRKLTDILNWSDDELEYGHDYIQTLFPLPEASQVNWSATIVDRRVFDAFRSRPELRESLRTALTRILSFYGFKWGEDASQKKIIRGPNFRTASQNWVHIMDHNHLRITRIIRSLRVLGLEVEALAFFEAVKSVQEASNISSRSLMYWSRAAFRPLNVAPEVNSEHEHADLGPKFLREFEAKRGEETSAKSEVGESAAGQVPLS